MLRIYQTYEKFPKKRDLKKITKNLRKTYEKNVYESLLADLGKRQTRMLTFVRKTDEIVGVDFGRRYEDFTKILRKFVRRFVN